MVNSHNPPQQPYANHNTSHNPMARQHHAGPAANGFCAALSVWRWLHGNRCCLSCHTSLAGVMPTAVRANAGPNSHSKAAAWEDSSGTGRKYGDGSSGRSRSGHWREVLCIISLTVEMNDYNDYDRQSHNNGGGGLLGGLGELGNDIGLF